MPQPGQMTEAKEAKPGPGYGPVYCAMYPDIARIAREHGYALAIHGSLQRDFDLVAIPWNDAPSSPAVIVEAILKHYDVRTIGEPTTKAHGRIAYTISVGWGHCAFDLSFMPTILLAQQAPASELLRLRERLAAAEKAVEAARIAMHGADRALGQASKFTNGIVKAIDGDGRFILDPKLVVEMDETAELSAKDARVFAHALAAYDALAGSGHHPDCPVHLAYEADVGSADIGAAIVCNCRPLAARKREEA